MADASSIRKAATLMTASGRNEGATRYNTTTRRPVWSNGQEWINYSTPVYRQNITYNAQAAANAVTKPFFIATKRCKVAAIKWMCATGEATGTTLTTYVTKESGTQAPGAGLKMTTANFDPVLVANGGTCVINTVQTGTLISATEELWLDPGDRLSVYYSGAATELADVQITIELESYTPTIQVARAMKLNGDCADHCFFVADQEYRLIAAKYVHAVAGSNATTVVQLTKENTDTTTPGAGTDILSNNTNTGFSCAATANTVQTGTFKTTAQLLNMGAGDRLSVDFANAVTALAGVVLTVELSPVQKTAGQFVVTNVHTGNAEVLDAPFFIATSPCVVQYVIHTNNAVGTDGGGVTAQLTRESGTTAPAGGTAATSTVNLKAAVETPQVATLSASNILVLDTGDRLSVNYGGTVTAATGQVITTRIEWLT